MHLAVHQPISQKGPWAIGKSDKLIFCIIIISIQIHLCIYILYYIKHILYYIVCVYIYCWILCQILGIPLLLAVDLFMNPKLGLFVCPNVECIESVDRFHQDVHIHLRSAHSTVCELENCHSSRVNHGKSSNKWTVHSKLSN